VLQPAELAELPGSYPAVPGPDDVAPLGQPNPPTPVQRGNLPLIRDWFDGSGARPFEPPSGFEEMPMHSFVPDSQGNGQYRPFDEISVWQPLGNSPIPPPRHQPGYDIDKHWEELSRVALIICRARLATARAEAFRSAAYVHFMETWLNTLDPHILQAIQGSHAVFVRNMPPYQDPRNEFDARIEEEIRKYRYYSGNRAVWGSRLGAAPPTEGTELYAILARGHL
jgi:hypothetical protein